MSELLEKVTGKKKQQLISDQQDGERRRQHALRSSSLAAISADSARSNAESIAEIFTGAELNGAKPVLEAGCRPIGGAPAQGQ